MYQVFAYEGEFIWVYYVQPCQIIKVQNSDLDKQYFKHKYLEKVSFAILNTFNFTVHDMRVNPITTCGTKYQY